MLPGADIRSARTASYPWSDRTGSRTCSNTISDRSLVADPSSPIGAITKHLIILSNSYCVGIVCVGVIRRTVFSARSLGFPLSELPHRRTGQVYIEFVGE